MTSEAPLSSAVQLGVRLRELRLERGTSVRHLAEEAGFSPSFISQVETGQASPSIASLERIAKVLGVGLSDLFLSGTDAPAVVRGSAREQLTSEWSRARIESLAQAKGQGGLDAVLITLRGGGRSGKNPHTQPAPQFAFVVAGAISLALGDELLDLESGDAVTIPAQCPHRWENAGIDQAQVLIVSAGPQRLLPWGSR